MPARPDRLLAALLPVITSLLTVGLVESGWSISAAPMSGRLPSGDGRGPPSWARSPALIGSPPESAGLSGLFLGGMLPSGVSAPHCVLGSIAAKMAQGNTISRSPAMLPSTSVPKILWPLLAVMRPRTSSFTRAGYREKLPATMLLLIASPEPAQIPAPLSSP